MNASCAVLDALIAGDGKGGTKTDETGIPSAFASHGWMWSDEKAVRMLYEKIRPIKQSGGQIEETDTDRLFRVWLNLMADGSFQVEPPSPVMATLDRPEAEGVLPLCRQCGVFQSTHDEVPAKVTAEATSVGSRRLPVLRVT